MQSASQALAYYRRRMRMERGFGIGVVRVARRVAQSGLGAREGELAVVGVAAFGYVKQTR